MQGLGAKIGNDRWNEAIATLVAQHLDVIGIVLGYADMNDRHDGVGGTKIDPDGNAMLRGMWFRCFTGFVNLQKHGSKTL